MADSEVNELRVFSDWRTKFVSVFAPIRRGHKGNPGRLRGNGHGVFNKGVDQWPADVRRFLARWVLVRQPRNDERS